MLNSWSSAYPQYTNYYTSHSDILELGGGNPTVGRGVLDVAAKLNIGLTFQDGQWVPVQ